MGALSKEMQNFHNSQTQLITSCKNYFLKDGNQLKEFDSSVASPEILPAPIRAIFDDIEPEYHAQIDRAVKLGISAYQKNNGGDMPHPSIIASALQAGVGVVQEYKSDKAVFDSVADLVKSSPLFDDASNVAYEQAAIVPALTVVTIASLIANSLPIVAMLPNPTGSMRVPIVAVRHVTDSTFGAMKAGEYIDGENAGLPYAEGRFRFAMPNTSGAAYSVIAHVAYDDYVAKTPDTNTKLLPFLSGNVSIRVNGIEVAHTRGDQDLSVSTGTISAMPKKGIVIDGTEYKVISSTIDIDNSKIDVEFNAALPSDAKVQVCLVADFNAKDANDTKAHKIHPVGLSYTAEYDTIQSVPMHNMITISYDSQNQLAQELGLGFTGVALAQMQGKVYLEQNVRLLGELYDRAIYNGRESVFDASRGVTGNLSSAYNTTADLVAEVVKHIELSKQNIRQASGGATVGYDLYVGDTAAILFKLMPPEKFKSTGAVATYTEIVRIGTLSDGTHVYQMPKTQGVLPEDVGVSSIMLVGRGNEPARNPLTGTITLAPTIREARKDTREAHYGLHSQMAAEVNPIKRYGDQSSVIHMINLPAL
ncbi:MAG: hypothetical protein ACK5LJ_03740 [Paracoccus sp. (in: a-proteobacteria)]